MSLTYTTRKFRQSRPNLAGPPTPRSMLALIVRSALQLEITTLMGGAGDRGGCVYFHVSQLFWPIRCQNCRACSDMLHSLSTFIVCNVLTCKQSVFGVGLYMNIPKTGTSETTVKLQ